VKRPAAAPVLADPGAGRRWDVQRLGVGSQARWRAALLSRSGTLIGYVGEYDNGWGANTKTHGRMGLCGRDGYTTAQAAADALLTARAGAAGRRWRG
jgi:hypothetical protein